MPQSQKKVAWSKDTRPLGPAPRIHQGGRKIWRWLGEQSNPLQTISVFIAMATIVWGVVLYLWTKSSNDELARREAHYAAWQVVNSAQGQAVSGGRIDALEDLVRDKVSLANLNAPNAQLDKVDLTGADLARANLSHASLKRAKLDGAYLSGSQLRGATLVGASLRGALLGDVPYSEQSDRVSVSIYFVDKAVDLEEAELQLADLSDAYLNGANFTNAFMAGVQLRGASLQNVNLNNANLYDTDLSGVNLSDSSLLGSDLGGAFVKDVTFKNADVQGASFKHAHDLTPQQIREAKHWELAEYDEAMMKQLGLIPTPVITTPTSGVDWPRPTLTAAP